MTLTRPTANLRNLTIGACLAAALAFVAAVPAILGIPSWKVFSAAIGLWIFLWAGRGSINRQ
jgi:hypothetical protein